jgi:membrane-bound ClpP family serine protease
MGFAILVSSDLMFISKVKEVAAAANGQVKVARSLTALEQAIAEASESGALMIDLEKSGVQREAMSEVVRRLSSTGWRVVSFFSHVHEEVADDASRLGLGEVMPRSRFVKILPSLFGI